MTCEGCIFVWRGNNCKKRDFITQLQNSQSAGLKGFLFLSSQLRILSRKRSCKFVGDVSGVQVLFDSWCGSIKRGLDLLDGMPLSEVKRKYASPSLRPVCVKAFCCWVRCPDQTCGVRGRGKRCGKQKKKWTVLEGLKP